MQKFKCLVIILFLVLNNTISVLLVLRPQSINCLVRISFAIKNEMGGWVEAKKFGFFEKNICILPVGYLTSSAK